MARASVPTPDTGVSDPVRIAAAEAAGDLCRDHLISTGEQTTVGERTLLRLERARPLIRLPVCPTKTAVSCCHWPAKAGAVPTTSPIEQFSDRHVGEPEGLVDFAVGEQQPAIGGDPGAAEFELDPAVDHGPQRELLASPVAHPTFATLRSHQHHHSSRPKRVRFRDATRTLRAVCELKAPRQICTHGSELVHSAGRAPRASCSGERRRRCPSRRSRLHQRPA
jgi:hypothetical protein